MLIDDDNAPPGYVWVCPSEEVDADYRAAMLRHWASLGGDDLRARFWHTPSPTLLSRRAELLDFEHVAISALAPADRPDFFVGMGETGPDLETGGRADLGFSLLADWRGKGLGKPLVRRMFWVAGRRKYTSVRIACLPDNLACKRLCEALGGAYAFTDDRERGQLIFEWPL